MKARERGDGRRIRRKSNWMKVREREVKEGKLGGRGAG